MFCFDKYMELHFDEIADVNGGGGGNKMSYDDILAKLNVKIIDGKMQYITPVGITNEHFSTKKGATVKKSGAVEPIVDKTSYIYNKYFKKEMSERVAVSPPKTREEYDRRLVEAQKKHAIEQMRMRQAKSKKLMFYSNNNYGRSAMVDPDSLFRINLKR